MEEIKDNKIEPVPQNPVPVSEIPQKPN